MKFKLSNVVVCISLLTICLANSPSTRATAMAADAPEHKSLKEKSAPRHMEYYAQARNYGHQIRKKGTGPDSKTGLERLFELYQRLEDARDRKAFSEALDAVKRIRELTDDQDSLRDIGSGAGNPLSTDILLQSLEACIHTEKQRELFDELARSIRRKMPNAFGRISGGGMPNARARPEPSTRDEPVATQNANATIEADESFRPKASALSVPPRPTGTPDNANPPMPSKPDSKEQNPVNTHKVTIDKDGQITKEFRKRGGEVAVIWVKGSGTTNLDIYIYDEKQNLLLSVEDDTDDCVAKWWPAWNATFTLRVKNRGAAENTFFIYEL